MYMQVQYTKILCMYMSIYLGTCTHYTAYSYWKFHGLAVGYQKVCEWLYTIVQLWKWYKPRYIHVHTQLQHWVYLTMHFMHLSQSFATFVLHMSNWGEPGTVQSFDLSIKDQTSLAEQDDPVRLFTLLVNKSQREIRRPLQHNVYLSMERIKGARPSLRPKEKWSSSWQARKAAEKIIF